MVLSAEDSFPSTQMLKLRRFKASGLALVCVAGTTLLASNPAKAADCTNDISTIAQLISAGSCTRRGVTLTYTPGSLVNIPNTSILTINGSPDPSANTFSIAVQADPSAFLNPFTGSFGYTITAPAGKYIVDYTSALSSALNLGNNTGTFDLTGAAGTAAATYVPTNTAIGDTKSYANQTTLSDAFTASIGVTNGGIEQFTQSFNFAPTPPPSTSVPGPLPLVGVGIAFGYSRKLRKRIAAA
jgi:hypothetical protein